VSIGFWIARRRRSFLLILGLFLGFYNRNRFIWEGVGPGISPSTNMINTYIHIYIIIKLLSQTYSTGKVTLISNSPAEVVLLQ